MSDELIDRNPDLKRLRDEQYDIRIRNGLLVVASIPYVTSPRKVTAYGMIVSELTLSGDRTQPPGSHQVWFCGGVPHDQHGKPLEALSLQKSNDRLFDGVVADFQFSSKPRHPDTYQDYHQKITTYVHAISDHATAINPSLTAKVAHPAASTKEERIFKYMDTASGRAGISGIKHKLARGHVAIIGLGGTGSYILDILAKNPVATISLFDGDPFCNHNAFRSPGAPSKEELETLPNKVDYLTSIYSRMHSHIKPCNERLTEQNINALLDGHDFDFVFVCVDNATARSTVANYLKTRKVPFIDVGMGLELVAEHDCLIGSCRVTLCTENQHDHFEKHMRVPVGGGDDVYGSNIQIAEMNMLNAALAVIKWKKHLDFYQDSYREHESVYEINTHQLSSSVDSRPALLPDELETGRIETIAYVPVEHVPEDMEDGKLYVSEKFKLAVHRCCCGCGEEVVTPLHPTEWSLAVEDGLATMKPSIGNWSFACRSHYWIREGRIVWAEDLSQEEIEYGRERDRKEKEEYYRQQRRLLNRILRWVARVFQGN